MTEKPSRNEDEYFVRQDAEILKKSRAALTQQQVDAERRTHYMKCPKDGHDLETRQSHGVAVETCAHCGGMWLDAGELDAISRHQDHHGLLGRVFGDMLATLKPHHRGEQPPRASGEPIG